MTEKIIIQLFTLLFMYAFTAAGLYLLDFDITVNRLVGISFLIGAAQVGMKRED